MNINGYYRPITYGYTNMNGGGDNNLFTNQNHNNQIADWHYVYMGYSKTEAKAQVYILYKSGPQKFVFNSVNHYFVDTYFILLRESQWPNYQGQQASVNVNLGKGSYVVNDKHDQDGDPFGFIAGKNALVKTVPAVSVDTGAPGAKYNAAENGDAVL